MSPTLTTFLFEAANFLLLAAVLGWLFFKPTRQALADQQAKFAAEEKLAADKLADARRAEKEIADARSRLQSELGELRSRELETARKQAEQVMADARTKAERLLESSRIEADSLSETQYDRLAKAAALAAAETVGRLLQNIGGPEIHAALFRSACQQLQDLPRDGLEPIKVESAVTLSAEDRTILKEVLGPAAANVDYRVCEDLKVGVRIATGRGLIDASASGLAGYARQALVRHSKTHEDANNLLDIGADG